VFRRLFVGAAALSLAGAAAAQQFPRNRSRLICPWPAGGVTDIATGPLFS
jgi:tripartite-type tricarboxylate transporter receptor subunit TctC